MFYGVRQANHHSIHHSHQLALWYNHQSVSIILLCCSMLTCLWPLMSTGWLLVATALYDALRVVDVHSVIVPQLFRLTSLIFLRLDYCWLPSCCLHQGPCWQTKTCTEFRGSSYLHRWSSKAHNSIVAWQTPLAVSERADCIQTMFIGLQGPEWYGT